MTWLFVQVWLWSLLAFALGVAFAWLLLVRPARARAARLEYALAQERARQEPLARRALVPEIAPEEPANEATRFEPMDERFVDVGERERFGAESAPPDRDDPPWLGGTGTDELPSQDVTDLPEWDETAESWSPSTNGHAAPDTERTSQADVDEKPQTSVIPIANLDSATRRPTFGGSVGEWPTVSPEDDLESGPTAPGMPTPERETSEDETVGGLEPVDAESTARVAPVDPPTPDVPAAPAERQQGVPGWFQKPPEVEDSEPDQAVAPDEPESSTQATSIEVPTEAEAVQAAGITITPDPEAEPLPRRTPGVGPRPGLQNLKSRSSDGASPEQAVGSARPEGVPKNEGDVVKGHFASRRYHTPDSPYYDRIVAEVWFADAEEAERAGFEPWDGWLRNRD
ncbi:hypothetical protein GIY23_20720 [Allosaccharopolyspora coralli]|uniref:Uncharacterized protein n=1 Tax=Allosaccharopolyspora coralli TaxID=2665642 RepID=A0A5Q3QCJ7_9PSEU|nr:hypothetical protein [Allosaccharopolyspora coralli]QGK71620.1 hypothetical protein GIY23_20720 [Allosaccharopolyspora coralli]